MISTSCAAASFGASATDSDSSPQTCSAEHLPERSEKTWVGRSSDTRHVACLAQGPSQTLDATLSPESLLNFEILRIPEAACLTSLQDAEVQHG